MNTCVFFGSTTGNTESVANKVAEALGCDCVSCDEVSKASDYELVVLASSTWGAGDLQDDWEDASTKLKDVDFSGKKVALVGVGDQSGYSDTFVNAMKALYDIVVSKGATIVGQTSTDGYSFDASESVVDGKFVGLVIDEDNQSDMTDGRIKNWVESLK